MDSDFKNPREWQANVREWLEVVEEHLSQIHDFVAVAIQR